MKKRSKKVKVKNLTKPPKYWDEEGYRYVGALMEDVQDNFRAFGENLAFVREKGNATFEEVGRIRIQLSEMNIRQDSMEKKQDSMAEDIKEIKLEIKSIKSEISELKQILHQKADIERLTTLEQKVFNIERHLKLST